MAQDLEDAARGVLLGTFIGDAMGMPVEGWTRQRIVDELGMLRGFVEGRLPAGTYTDDTEMAVGMAESLVECGRFDPAHVASRLAENFTLWRGYTSKMYGMVSKLRQASWDRAGQPLWDSGAAVRVGPLGLFYCGSEEIVSCAEQSCRITHTHPNALAGTVVMAVAVAEAVRRGLLCLGLERKELVDLWISNAAEHGEGLTRSLRRVLDLKEERDLSDRAGQLAKAFSCDETAVGGVPAALAAFLWSSCFEDAVVVAVNAGGDADTIGAMAGALAGAYYGASGIPEDLLQCLSDEDKGRTHLSQLGRSLGRMARSGSAGSFELLPDGEDESPSDPP